MVRPPAGRKPQKRPRGRKPLISTEEYFNPNTPSIHAITAEVMLLTEKPLVISNATTRESVRRAFTNALANANPELARDIMRRLNAVLEQK